ncbi:MAG: N-6 DNA methylase [Chloroflexi bacterium]|nr:N-6 DNA methylase [Chloroflexota bacterium]
MPMSNLGYSNTIPVTPLPPNALEAVYDGLRLRGFQRQAIEADYAFSDRNGRQVETNLLAFAHETFRTPDYRGVTVFNPANGIDDRQLAQTLAQSAAPFHLIHRQQTERFSFWFTNATDKNALNVEATPIQTDIEYTHLSHFFERYATDISPQRIVDVKQGRDFFKHFEHAGSFQLSLWAIDATGDLLVTRFGRAVEALRQHALPTSLIADVATQLLGATILAHTGAFGPDLRRTDPSLDHLISVAHNSFPNYFDLNLFNRWYSSVTPAYNILTELRYSNFSPELLTRLYQEAFPDVRQRRELGRYDTPLYLTRRIWETIPVEFLPPERRVAADMTCGWGSFLISGHERLSRIMDMRGHSLREHLYGNDNEQFATRLAGLGLLISTLQDSWHISSQDGLNWEIPGLQPNIIVGNPPFHGSRKDPSEEHAESPVRFERANQFLSHAIDILAPDGFLAMLMPQSFVAAEASPQLRRKLLESCDVFEMWELPLGAFDGAQTNPLVIFAQKKAQRGLSNFPVKIRNVQAKQLDIFKDNGPFTASNLVGSQIQWNEQNRRSQQSRNTHIFDYQFILPQYSWDKIRSNCEDLSSKAIIFPGTIQGHLDRRRHTSDPNGKSIQLLAKPKKVINDSFQIRYSNPKPFIYPNDFEEPRIDKEGFLAGNKVLINALANPSWGKRVKAVIDRRGFFVSHNFIVLVPKPTEPFVTNEVLAAVIDWKVGNAWLLEHLKQTQFPMRAIRSLPFPHLTKEDCEQLTHAVLEIENAWFTKVEDVPEAKHAIDMVLRNAYQLNEEKPMNA